MNWRIYNSGARATKNAHKQKTPISDTARTSKPCKRLKMSTCRHLVPAERQRIIILYERGERLATIAAMPGRSECTV